MSQAGIKGSSSGGLDFVDEKWRRNALQEQSVIPLRQIPDVWIVQRHLRTAMLSLMP